VAPVLRRAARLGGAAARGVCARLSAAGMGGAGAGAARGAPPLSSMGDSGQVDRAPSAMDAVQLASGAGPAWKKKLSAATALVLAQTHASIV
jgi:hypothetical protein